MGQARLAPKRNRRTFFVDAKQLHGHRCPLPAPFRRGFPVSAPAAAQNITKIAMALAPKRQLRPRGHTNNSSYLSHQTTNPAENRRGCRQFSNKLIIVASANMLSLKAFSLKGEKKTRLGGKPPAWLRACQPQRSCLEFLLRRKRWDRDHRELSSDWE